MSSVILSVGAGYAVGFLYASVVEYGLHRWVLHRAWRLLRRPYELNVFLHL